ncbi:YoaK family protein [Puia sp. P3]|uniref:YoaK family protein n=1 Tax=Puia sp. P3 TaxID=3423952 RepID=UPI003D672E80
MLRHVGAHRSFRHNVRLATLLSLNAGFINAAGFIAFSVLTTNVTGHAALLAVNAAQGRWREVRMVALWLSLFLAGAFFSAWLIGWIGRRKSVAYTIPIVLIIGVLVRIIFWGPAYDHSLQETELFAGSLLFAMGMQNALVSVISGSVVRTTHLTGMMTDLGIDLSAVVHSFKNVGPVLARRVKLRLVIILSFLSGGLVGGYLF